MKPEKTTATPTDFGSVLSMHVECGNSSEAELAELLADVKTSLRLAHDQACLKHENGFYEEEGRANGFEEDKASIARVAASLKIDLGD